MAEVLEWPFLLLNDMDALKNMRQQDLFMSLKWGLVLVSFSTWSPWPGASFFFFTYLMECFRCFYAGRQEVFAAEELVKDTCNEARLADNFRMKANKSLAVTKGRNKELAL